MTVQGIDDRKVDTPTEVTRAVPGMILVNESLEPIAQTAEGTNKTAILLDRIITMDDVPDTNGAGIKRAWLMPYGPGTVVEMPNCARYIAG